MAANPSEPHFSPESELARFPRRPWQFHEWRTYGLDGTQNYSPWMQHPGQLDPRNRGSFPPPASFTATANLGFGCLLLPYILDWGDRVGLMTKKKAYVSVLKAYPAQSDRTYALSTVNVFCSPKDRFTDNFYEFLCRTQPFAGWRWHAGPLQAWMRFAKGQANHLGAAGSLDPTTAMQAALDWCAAVVEEWKLSTIEHFPYGPRDMNRYWQR